MLVFLISVFGLSTQINEGDSCAEALTRILAEGLRIESTATLEGDIVLYTLYSKGREHHYGHRKRSEERMGKAAILGCRREI